jgi:DNA-binding NtrC family response regulator
MKKVSNERQDLDILLVEDDAAFREQVVKLLGVYNDITESASMSEARSILSRSRFDVVILDKSLPDGNGLDLIPEIKTQAPSTVVIVLTGDSNFNLVKKCLDAGATDYLYKSENIVPDLLVRVPLAVSRVALEQESAQLSDRLRQAFRYEIVGRSQAMHELRTTVQSLKGSRTPVLITGETGTGKELVAKRLNAVEEKASRPFQTLNCGAIPENLVESALFGHVKGAFTGATENQVGKFALADGGDLFLDEVAELPLQTQIKLLRVLQEGEFSPVGSKDTFSVSVRVIAATNRPLEQLVDEGKFRSDLYYRLNVFPIRTVPLRERPEDISDLAQFFLVQGAGHRFELSQEGIRHLAKQTWPGNIRELRNTIERAVLLAKRRGSLMIEKQDLASRAASPSGPQRLAGPMLPKALEEVSNKAYGDFLEFQEREYLRSVLVLCEYNIAKAASHLGIGRSTIFRRLAALGLTQGQPRLSEASSEGVGLRRSSGDSAGEVSNEL